MDIAKEFKNKKELILNTAQKIFAYFGLKKTTVDDIAKQAGIGKSTVYSYFKSKDDLFTAVVKREEEELKKIILNKINKTNNPSRKLEIFILTKIEHFFNLKNFYQIKKDFLNEIYPKLENIIQSYYDFEKKIFTEILINGTENNLFDIKNINLSVNMLIITLRALEHYWFREEKYTIKEVLKEARFLLEMFFKGIEKKY